MAALQVAVLVAGHGGHGVARGRDCRGQARARGLSSGHSQDSGFIQISLDKLYCQNICIISICIYTALMHDSQYV